MVLTCSHCHAVSAVLRLNGSPKLHVCPGCQARYEVSVREVAPPVNLKAGLQPSRYEQAG